MANVDDLKAKFAPKFNQSDIKDYRSSDLMVWSRSNSHLASSVTTLDAELKHAFASIYLTPTAYRLDDGKDTKCNIMVSDVSLTIGDNVYVPNQTTDGSLRCIVPANINPSGIRCFYTFSGTTYGNTINIQDAVTSNTCYTSAPEIINKIYRLTDAKVGDFYCKNSDNKGYLIPGDVALTDEQKKACLGIVMKVGKDDTNPWKDDCDYKYKDSAISMGKIHGYVLALHDANDGNGCHWGPNNTWERTTIEEDTGFYGYKNTQVIILNHSGNLASSVPATYYATEHYEYYYPAPVNSSGWFLPSSGQGRYWLNNSTTLLEQVKKAMVGGDSYNWKGWYWSSSEVTNNSVYTVNFIYGSLYIGAGNKDTGSYVHSCLVF